MAIGPGIYFNEYKDYSVDELERELEKLQKYLSSDELKKARQEEIDKEIDDNNCIENVRTEIDVIKDLIKTKKEKFKSGELNNNENHRCPICFSILKEYVYGKIKGEINTDKYIVGGCILRENNPTYYCSKCNYDYDKNLNLMTETLEKVIESFIGNDPFWKDLLKEYFNKLTNISEEEKISFLKKLASNKDLFNEFTKEIIKCTNVDELFDKYTIMISDYIEEKNNNSSESEYDSINGNAVVPITLDEAIKKAKSKASECGKIIMEILENEEWWCFEAGLPNKQFFDDGAGSIYVNKKDGTIRGLNLWDVEFTTKFRNDAVTIYDYYKNETLCPNCNEKLMFLHPDGSYLYCNKCEKYYLNNNGDVGDETTSPYDKNDDVLY